MMDETTDVSGKEQATICVRHFSNGELREDFLGFVHAQDLTGEGLARLLLSTVESVGLGMSSCRGLCFDGASAMMGKFRGCAAVVMREYPLAKIIHCFNHRLNLVLTKACDTKEVKLALQTLSQVYNFIYSSNMRSMRFDELVRGHTSMKRQKLVSLCPTRWVERHDSIIVFMEFLPIIAVLLEDESSLDAMAGILLIAIREPRFLIGLVVAESILAHTVEPSRALQSPTVNLISAYATIGEVVTYLKKAREEALTSFHDVFKKAEELLQEIGSSHETIPVPRVCGRQTQRANVPFQTAEEYYRRAVYVPFLDQVVTELQSRFGDDTIPVGFNIRHLLSGADGDIAALVEAAKVYEVDIEALSLVKAEAERWFSSAAKFDSIGDALAHAQTRMYPNLAKLLQVLITLPVSNAEAECSFSVLKRLKTYLRNTMGQKRLNGLALLAVHNETEIEIDSVIKMFSQKNRRLMFV